MKIDYHSHYLPREYLELLVGHKGYPTVERKNGDYYLARFKRQAGGKVSSMHLDIDEKLRDMDEAGVDMQVLSMQVTMADSLEPEFGLKLAQTANDVLVDIISKHPDRFRGLATLPMQDAKLALGEMDRAIKKLKLSGLAFCSNVAGKPLDSPEFMPLYQRAEEMDVPIFIHPTYPVLMEKMEDYGLYQVVGFLFDTTQAMCRIILSGVMERHPNLRFVLAHLGSTIPYIIARIDKESGRVPGGRGQTQKLPSEYFKQVFIDTVSLHMPSLKCAYETMGPDKIVYGSDYPSWELPGSVEILQKWRIPKAEKEKIFYQTAQKLLKMV